MHRVRGRSPWAAAHRWSRDRARGAFAASLQSSRIMNAPVLPAPRPPRHSRRRPLTVCGNVHYGVYHSAHSTSCGRSKDGRTQHTAPTSDTDQGGPVATAVARKLDTIRASGGIGPREIPQLLEGTPPTVSRWRTGRSTPWPKSLDPLLWLEWLAAQLAQEYPPAEARVWLLSPHRDLEGERFDVVPSLQRARPRVLPPVTRIRVRRASMTTPFRQPPTHRRHPAFRPLPIETTSFPPPPRASTPHGETA